MSSGYHRLPDSELDRIARAIQQKRFETTKLAPSQWAATITDALPDYVERAVIGNPASFSDGANNVPVKELVINIEPVQAGSGESSPENYRPISGWTGIDLKRTGKNLFDKNNYQSMSAYISTTIAAQGIHTLIYMPCDAGVTYTAQRVRTVENERFGMCFTADLPQIGDMPLNKTLAENYGTIGETVTVTATAPENATYLCIWAWWTQSEINLAKDTLQIEIGSTATEYEPYQGDTYSVAFPAEAETVYGGTLNVTTGELTVTHAAVHVTSALGFVQMGNANPYGTCFAAENIPMPRFKSRSDFTALPICTSFVYGTGRYSDSPQNSFWWNGESTALRFVFGEPNKGTTVEEFNTFLDSVDVIAVGELAEPITYQLTPIQIRTLLGDNLIWADCGGVSVTYRADSGLLTAALAAAQT